MTLNMSDFMDDTIRSVVATRTPQGGSYVDGKWSGTASTPTTHNVTLQSLDDRARDVLERGGERVTDGRVVYINDGTSGEVAVADLWTFPGVEGTFRALRVDNRPWRSYCKLVVTRSDV